MLWLIITVIAYAFNSVALLMDKFLLDKKIPNPAVYTLVVCLLGLLGVALWPIDFQMPTFWQAFWSIASGVIFAPGLYFMFLALLRGESSRVITFLGGLQPIIILPLAWFFLGETFGFTFWVAFVLLLAGTVLISLDFSKHGKYGFKPYLFGIIAAILFAISLVVAKWTYLSMDSFITPFVLSRVGAGFVVLPLLLLPGIFKEFRHSSKNTSSSRTGFLLIIGQACGALASLLINIAIAVSVNATAIINAMQGLQYVFMLIGVIILTKFFPQILKEKLTPMILTQKIVATALIIAGLVAIAL